MNLPELSVGQYSLVFNMLSFTIASMFATFVFLVLARQQVAPVYRGALVLSALVVFIAGYHYFRISESWKYAYTMASSGNYAPTGVPFNDAYRYVDWLLTVPLLLAELVAVLRLPQGAGKMLTRLIIAAVLMIATGYPGEITTDVPTRLIWGTISTVPFVYILWVLWGELGRALERQPASVRSIVGGIRVLVLATWGFYPIAYLLPVFFGSTPTAAGVVGVQVGYSIADVLAKCAYGLVIYWIAVQKTREDGAEVPSDDEVTPIAAPA